MTFYRDTSIDDPIIITEVYRAFISLREQNIFPFSVSQNLKAMELFLVTDRP